MSRTSQPAAGVTFRIDWIRCDGYGLCGDLAPNLIGLDDWRYPILPRGPLDPRDVEDARRAVDCCPMRALALDRVSPPIPPTPPVPTPTGR